MIRIGEIEVKTIPTIKSVYVGDIQVFPSDITSIFRRELESKGVTVLPEFESLYENLSDEQKNSDIILLPVAGSEGIVYAMDAKTGMPIELPFARASKATFFSYSESLNKTIIETADINIPRLDAIEYGESLKLLIEKTSSNMVTGIGYTQVGSIGNSGVNCFGVENYTYVVGSGQFSAATLVYINSTKADLVASLAFRKAASDEVDFALFNSTFKERKRIIGNCDFKQGKEVYQNRVTFLDDTTENIVSASYTDFTKDDEDCWIYKGRHGESVYGSAYFGIPQIEIGSKKTSYISFREGSKTRSADLLKVNIKKPAVVDIRASDTDPINLNVDAGELDIHELLSESTGIELMTIKFN